ncbi:MAG: hypothetical protein CL678_01495 [Bdellovibrionaceae bacterium]|nr:hypothetical protein [Pseudobdellovibrionaceae bacterium]
MKADSNAELSRIAQDCVVVFTDGRGITTRTGVNWNETKNLSTQELRPFIERDIFLEMKHGKIPKFLAVLEIDKKELIARIIETEVQVTNPFFFKSRRREIETASLDESTILKHYPQIFSPDGLWLMARLARILWKYNLMSEMQIDGFPMMLKSRFVRERSIETIFKREKKSFRRDSTKKRSQRC